MKAILVIDMPETCYYCPCYTTEYGDFCQASNKELKSTEIPAWCPLRPLPERKEVHYTDSLFGEVENLTNIGYNKCLDEIIGETE